MASMTFVIEGDGAFEGSEVKLTIKHPDLSVIEKKGVTPEGTFFGQDITLENLTAKIMAVLRGMSDARDNIPMSLKGSKGQITWDIK